MGDAINKRLVIVAGKGGVGRTTVSAAMGLAAAKQGKRVLIAMCHVKEQLSHMLEVAPIGASINQVLPRIDAVNILPEAALREYGQLKIKIPLLYRAVFENKTVLGFLRATPGIEAWSMLGKVCYHVHQREQDHRFKYDLVILDAPATGHCLDMLRVPRVILDLVPSSLLRKDAEAAWELLQDSAQTAAVVVSWPEEMPVNEAIELQHGLEDELNINVTEVIANGVIKELFQPEERKRLTQLPQHGIAVPGKCVVQAAYRRSLRETEQVELLATLAKASTKPLVSLPRLVNADLKRAHLEELSTYF